ncbi:hypothetical protein EAE99_011572 [Botrytis elliptica]|nr:hypothetical protein EAE99_011572 [Botrytis elliptica]
MPLDTPPRSPIHICSYAIEDLTSACKVTWIDLDTRILRYWVRYYDSSTTHVTPRDKELQFVLTRRLGLNVYSGKITKNRESVEDILSKKIKSKIDSVRRTEKLNSSPLGLKKSERLNGKEKVEAEVEAQVEVDVDQIASSDPPRPDTPRPDTPPYFERFGSGSGSDSQNLPAQTDRAEPELQVSFPIHIRILPSS